MTSSAYGYQLDVPAEAVLDAMRQAWGQRR